MQRSLTRDGGPASRTSSFTQSTCMDGRASGQTKHGKRFPGSSDAVTSKQCMVFTGHVGGPADGQCAGGAMLRIG
eukprot:362070-Chlamydomonas_euryale.AAC.9